MKPRPQCIALLAAFFALREHYVCCAAGKHQFLMTGVSSQRVQPGLYTLMDALIQSCGPERPLVHQPLIPQILTAAFWPPRPLMSIRP